MCAAQRSAQSILRNVEVIKTNAWDAAMNAEATIDHSLAQTYEEIHHKPIIRMRDYHRGLMIFIGVMFLLWQLIKVLWLDKLPPATYRGADLWGSVVWLIIATTFVFTAMARYEKMLLELNSQLR